ncbi:hypothetical protein HAX54_018608 [Datura stramonium]|uniref:Uncharacterized protein n=1 Tax=Datura stramonium TaxID=4076 RepID=A0ABS8UPP0_DATST|nr:hypothetical protein [Datura stramonium]
MKVIEFAEVTEQQRKKDGATKIPLINLGKGENGGKIGGNEKQAWGDNPAGKSVADLAATSKELQSYESHVCAVQQGAIGSHPTSPKAMQSATKEGNRLETIMQSPNGVGSKPMGRMSGSSSSKMSWADEVERQQNMKKESVWDKFDIAKMSNAGFKLEFVEPAKHDSKPEESLRLHKWMPQKGASLCVEGNGETQRGLREDKTLSEQGRKYRKRSTIMGAGVPSGSTQDVQLEQGNTFQILEGIEPEYEMQIPRNTPRKSGGGTPKSNG